MKLTGVRVLTAVSLAAVVLVTAAVASGGPSKQSGAIDRALANIRANAKAAHAGSDQDFTARDVIVDSNGAEHVRFDRSYKGLRVVGGDLVVHDAAAGNLLGLSQTLQHDLTLGTSPSINSEGAARKAAALFAGSPANSKADLVVYAFGTLSLAWEVTVSGDRSDGSPSELHVFVDAVSGDVLDSWDAIENVTGTGHGFFNGTVALETTPINGGFSLTDPTRGNQYTADMKNRQGGKGALFTDADNDWGNGTLGDRATVAVDAQYGAAQTWDYYKFVHGRNGIANDGVGAASRVHYGRGYNNAFWSDSCFCMTYGDGDGVTFNPFDSLDVAGHEMSHGVTSRTANLTYSGESGGLNEATSDIFGTMVEFRANNANDTPDYKIGEELYRNNPGEATALRYMWKPSLDGKSADCWYSGVGSLNVHYSSGVGNHLFYLLAEGSNANPASPTCNASNVTGVGRSAAERIWYRALTVYMTSGTDYHGARSATLSAAADLFGAGSSQYNAVNAAWAAVSVT